MKFSKQLLLLMLLTLFLLTACKNSNCDNQNPIFENNDMSSGIYKAELIKQISENGIQNLSFWFDGYQEKQGKEYIIVKIKGENLCTKGMFKVENWGKLSGIQSTKGEGYRGAELEGFLFGVEKDSQHTELIFKNVIKIID